MSKEYRFTPIHGEYPLIKAEIRDGQRYVRLSCSEYTTATHRHFADAFEEWQDHAGRVEMEDLLDAQE